MSLGTAIEVADPQLGSDIHMTRIDSWGSVHEPAKCTQNCYPKYIVTKEYPVIKAIKVIKVILSMKSFKKMNLVQFLL